MISHSSLPTPEKRTSKKKRKTQQKNAYVVSYKLLHINERSYLHSLHQLCSCHFTSVYCRLSCTINRIGLIIVYSQRKLIRQGKEIEIELLSYVSLCPSPLLCMTFLYGDLLSSIQTRTEMVVSLFSV